MPKKKKEAMCSIEPIFPQKAYIIFLFILHEGQSVGMIPLESIYTTPVGASDAVHQLLNQLGPTEHVTVTEESLLIPVTFNSLFPMRPDFWTKPTLKYTQQLRVQSFAPITEYPAIYSLLVTPYLYEENENVWHLNATLPFIHNDSVKTHALLEQFMLTSDQVVESKAKYSAIYTLGDKKQFNWKTGKIKKIKESVNELLGNRN
jgi:hypothetical protein